MQSGISASSELLSTFNDFVSNPSERFLLASISSETLIPLQTLPSTSPSFKSDLPSLQQHLSPTVPLYILLKTHPSESNGYVAVTYIPNAAPVRQKMLFASTRLSLVRELGIERFRETVFVTEARELTAEGWEAHERHVGLEAPLTEEEKGAKGVREAEMVESSGTGGRKGYVRGGGGVELEVGEGVREALTSLRIEEGKLVQFGFRLPDEKLVLEGEESGVKKEDVVQRISKTEPRYSFYNEGRGEGGVVFIYTCPSGSKIKERMVYSTGKSWVRNFVERDCGVVVGRSLEGTEPEEVEGELMSSGKEEEVVTETAKPGGSAFARPKRPGRK